MVSSKQHASISVVIHVVFGSLQLRHTYRSFLIVTANSVSWRLLTASPLRLRSLSLATLALLHCSLLHDRPWQLTAEVFMFLGWSWTPQLPPGSFDPREELALRATDSSKLERTPFGIQIYRYKTSPVGPYDELMYIPGFFRTTTVAADGSESSVLAPRITRIYISTDATALRGRENWNIPKVGMCLPAEHSTVLTGRHSTLPTSPSITVSQARSASRSARKAETSPSLQLRSQCRAIYLHFLSRRAGCLFLYRYYSRLFRISTISSRGRKNGSTHR